MNKMILLKKSFVVLLFLCLCTITFAQQYGQDNILNFYTIEQSVYIPYGQKVIYQDFDIRMEIDVDSASFVSAVYPSDFAFDKKGVYYEGKLVDTDTTGFRFLSRKYWNRELHIWKNRKQVYLGDSILKDIDAETCVMLANGMLRDKNGYYKDFVKVTDKRENKKLLKEYPQGNEGVPYIYLTKYMTTLHILNQNKQLENIDPESFEVLGLYYAKDKNGVCFFDESSRKLKRIEKADKDSFKDLSNHNGCFAYDKNYAYFNDKRLDYIQGGNIQVLGVYMGYRKNSEFDPFPDYNYFLIKDHYYYWMVSEQKIFCLGAKYPEHIINRNQEGKRILFYW